MKFVLYTSVLNQHDYDALVVSDIIKTARIENGTHEITGVLLFDGINFTQYFEGKDADVDQLLDNILRDKRHRNITVILSGQHQHRLYENWGMGYIDISGHDLDIERCMSDADFSIDTFKQKVSRLDVE